MPQVELTLLIGGYAQKWTLGRGAAKSLTETVKRWRDFGPATIPLPHPSWRNNAWIKKNPWFSAELLPFLKSEMVELTILQASIILGLNVGK